MTGQWTKFLTDYVICKVNEHGLTYKKKIRIKKNIKCKKANPIYPGSQRSQNSNNETNKENHSLLVHLIRWTVRKLAKCILNGWENKAGLKMVIINILLVSQYFQVPSLDADAILVESLLKLKQYTPAEWPFNSNALLTSWKSPDLLKHTSHTFTSGVKPVKAINV